MLSLTLVVLQLIFQLSFSQNCVYTDSTTGRKFYLDALAHASIKYQNTDTENDGHYYTLTPCRNAAVECPNSGGGTDTSMVSQTMQNDASICTVIANYDSTISPRFSDEDSEGVWDFTFQNGDKCDENDPDSNSRELFLTFLCNEGAGDYNVVEAGETYKGSCSYEIQIETKWACPDQVYTEDTTSLSGGWIFLIILFSGIFAYFLFGWILCAFMNRKDRGFGDVCGNVPHGTFWTKLPSLVFAGCCFTKDFLFGMCDKSGGDSNQTSGANGGGGAYENID
eukprot:CAMPEP_0201569996 /NCGR_PEP_ID=MMETSP0190_2-20130828/12025_1 /ASSEMBLY_ACC=CAM_ASM_000263 /TAXON_ID=37353 /ORGANISM="Rosalina sp." /LENGTH=280 /DNA_ID=CAMNT_0047993021 /DNA_START=31 /DNA_END=873 /DNA_ORIENTATION=+